MGYFLCRSGGGLVVSLPAFLLMIRVRILLESKVSLLSSQRTEINEKEAGVDPFFIIR